jgi:hypothetical protein
VMLALGEQGPLGAPGFNADSVVVRPLQVEVGYEVGARAPGRG